jgi:ribosome biogenesis GTPase
LKQDQKTGEGIVVRVEPRERALVRSYRGKEHVICANVDQALIVSSVANPELKVNLIDRCILSAERGGLAATVCLNKIDLVDPTPLQPIIGLYRQLGYPTIATSVETGDGLDELRELLADRRTVIIGRSGVGKSSLLNALNPMLNLKVSQVSDWSGKGRHTTTTARFLKLADGGIVVDTPGVRQFDLWEIGAADTAAYFREFVPFAHRCRFPGCTHRHERPCGVATAVDAGMISSGRYDSYLRLFDSKDGGDD